MRVTLSRGDGHSVLTVDLSSRAYLGLLDFIASNDVARGRSLTQLSNAIRVDLVLLYLHTQGIDNSKLIRPIIQDIRNDPSHAVHVELVFRVEFAERFGPFRFGSTIEVITIDENGRPTSALAR